MQKNKKDLWFVLIGTFISFLLSSIFHFSYELLGESPLLAGLFPVNESVWEHLKLPFYSILLLIMVPQSFYLKKIEVCNRIIMICVSTFISIIVVFFGYYGLKCGLKTESILTDLLLLIVGLVLGLFHSTFYKQKEVNSWECVLGILYIFGMIFLFYYFSYHPLALPVFAV